MKPVTAKTFPVGEDGRFQSGPAEAAFLASLEFGLTRDEVRDIIQAYQCAQDECDRQYQEFRAKREAELAAAELNARLAEREANFVGDPSRTSDGFPHNVTNATDPPPSGDMSLGKFQREIAGIDILKREAEKRPN